jgi:hypothetical protein
VPVFYTNFCALNLVTLTLYFGLFLKYYIFFPMNTFGETDIPVLFDQVTGRGTVVLAS